jgi:hypothetical protein
MKYFCLMFASIIIGCSESPPNPTNNKQVVSTDSLTVSYVFSDLEKDNSFESSRVICELNDQRFSEVSGIAESWISKGMFYVEEDSGNPNQIQLTNSQCSVGAVFQIGNVTNRDWEDIVVSKGPDVNKTYIYLADIGDNKSQYASKFIYRFEEPIPALQQNVNVISTFDMLEMELPDGPLNAEAIMVDPITRDFYLISKDNTTSVYVAPYPQAVGKKIQMKKIAILPFSKITSAGISPDGNELVIKTTSFICYWHKSKEESIAALLKTQPRLISYTIEQQGEGFSFASDGSGYYTISEKPDPNVAQPLYFYQRK